MPLVPRSVPIPVTLGDHEAIAPARDDGVPNSPAPRRGRAVSSDNPNLHARFERDVVPLRESLYRQAIKMTRNHDDAEDLLQDTMVRAYSGFHSFRQGSNLQAWLHRILTNTYINTYRKKQREPKQYPTAEITDRQLRDMAEKAGPALRSAEEQALESLSDNTIKAAMQALPEQFRMVVYYADVQGYRRREIAQIMRTPNGTVVSRLQRGRQRLRDLLASAADPIVA